MVSRALAEAGRAVASGRLTRALSQRRRSFFMYGFQPGTDRPHRLLGQDALEGRHVDTAIAHRTLADALQEDFVALVAERQVAQVRGDTAGNAAQAVAAGTVLVVGRIADADRRGILAIRIGRQEIRAELLQAGGIDRLRHDVTVRKD